MQGFIRFFGEMLYKETLSQSGLYFAFLMERRKLDIYYWKLKMRQVFVLAIEIDIDFFIGMANS